MMKLFFGVIGILMSLTSFAGDRYYNGVGDLLNPKSWVANIDGSGKGAKCFCKGDRYILTNIAYTEYESGREWTFKDGSTMVIGHPGNGDTKLVVFNRAGGIVGNVEVTSSGSLEVRSTQITGMNLVAVHKNSTVTYGGDLLGNQVVNRANYGNLVLTGSGAVNYKELPQGLLVNGNLTLDAELSSLLGNVGVEVLGNVTVLDGFGVAKAGGPYINLNLTGLGDQEVFSSRGLLEIGEFTIAKRSGNVIMNATDVYVDQGFSIQGVSTLITGPNILTAISKMRIDANCGVEVSAGGMFVTENYIQNMGLIDVKGGASAFEQSGAFIQGPNSRYVDGGVGKFRIGNNIGWMPHSRYTYWSTPVQGGKLTNVPQFAANYYYEDMSSGMDGWQWSSHDMEAGRGYALNEVGGDEVKFEGVPNNGVIQGPMVGLPEGKTEAWSLVGNPYPSPVLASALLETNRGYTGGAIYIWDQASFEDQWGFQSIEYTIVNALGMVGPGIQPEMSTFNYWIAPFQGFFVEGIGTPHVFTFNNEMRSLSLTDNRTFGFKSNNETKRVWLDLREVNYNYKTSTLIGIQPEATFGWDDQFDASPNSDAWTLVTEAGGQDAVIQGIPAVPSSKRMLLKAILSGPGEFEIKLSEFENWDHELWIEDPETNEIVDAFVDVMQFEFTDDGGEKQFILHFEDPNGAIIGIANWVRGDDDLLYFANRYWRSAVHGEVRIVTIDGREIGRIQVTPDSIIQLPDNNEVYIVNLLSVRGEFVSKKTARR